MGQLLEDHSGQKFTSLDFGAAIDRQGSAPNLPVAPATQLIVAPTETLEDRHVILAARREKRAPSWVLRSMLHRIATFVVRTLEAATARVVRTKERIAPPPPTALEREDSAGTVIGPAPRPPSQWDVSTQLVRKRTWRGSLTHDLELDD